MDLLNVHGYLLRNMRFCVLIAIILVNPMQGKWVDESVWTDKLGEELWEFGKLVTKHTEIKSKYINLNPVAQDGHDLLKDIMKNLDKMIHKKIQSVRCIAEAAEKLRRDTYFMNDFKLAYYNMKYSHVEGSNYVPVLPWELDELTEYKNMSLEPNPSFYDIPVNTNYSAVHVPTNVYDRYQHVAETIEWSQNLDEIFLKNYQADPALSWQYFGSSFGMMRQFPAMQWSFRDQDVDLYDCRMRPWFIEASTCTKDIVILMDNSGSMTGMRNTIAKLVVNSLLKTFGNNDFINVLKFSWTPESVLPCYKDMLVQATPEILKSFQEAVSLVKPEGNSSFPNAFAYSLKLLKQYRENRNVAEDGGCNQAIMLVTDGLSGNVTEVFENFNLDPDGMPLVRIFTFLVGTEVKGVEHLQTMACNNRGYYVHIHDLDEVHDQILKYIPVIARPLVLQGVEHPVVWTHAFADVNAQGEEKIIEYQKYGLMTSVSMPVFDKRENNETATAELLGVAGADVSMDQIYSLTCPYKIGTNGYAFLVNNNGYLLMHPDLRPVYDGTLKINYNSIDLAEVEFFDGDDLYNEFNPEILNMRKSMVDQIPNDFIEKKAKFHYDDMQRVGIEKRNYYIRPLLNTPFSIGLVLPSDFAAYHIKKSFKTESNDGNFTSKPYEPDKYLKKKNFDERDMEWSIHPDWIYCKYQFPTYKSFESKEDELLHFLEKIKEPDWQWKDQYGNDDDREDDDDTEDECNRPRFEEDSYYCDRDLVEHLMVDAEILENFRKPRIPNNSFETKLLDTYNPNLRFVATQSGLTKWQKIPAPKEGESTDSDFVTAYPRSINEPWYKMAVLQHHVDEESFSFSVPFKSEETEEVYVVATHALFHKKTHRGKKGPAAVIGYRFEQISFYERFMEITSERDKFTLPCNSDARECYVLDQNAYIVISSKSANETGRFFGDIESYVLSYLIERGIYEKKTIFDYQGLCIEELAVTNNANYLLTPWIFLKNILHYIFTDIFLILKQVIYLEILNPHSVYSSPTDINEFRDYDSDESLMPDEEDEDEYETEKEEFLNATVQIIRKAWPCHKNKTLYILQQHVFSEKFIYGVRHNSSRFRFVNRIPHTNLILVVLNTLYKPFDDTVLSVEPNVLPPDDCRESKIYDLPRRRLHECFTRHPEEVKVSACGNGRILRSSIIVILLNMLFLWRMPVGRAAG